jgi:nucleotide-binding universal stress UspA family protein
VWTDFVSPREIVVASDLTDTEILLPHVIAQAQATGARVTIVHAVGNTSLGSSMKMFDPSRDEVSIAQTILHQMENSLRSAGIECTVVAKPGLAVDTVNGEIKRIGAGRLIIGTHSHGPAGQAMIGCVANALLQTADIPVFVIGPGATNSAEHARPRRILHPVALSGHYSESAEFASEIAACYRANLVLLHLINPAGATGFYANEIATRDEAALEALSSSLTPRPEVVTEYGEIVPEILRSVETSKSDWIIMGFSHDFPWWSMQNNHAYQVIAESPCPVLTLHSRIFTSIDLPPEIIAQSA